MKFIVDAQLPRILVTHVIALGHDAVHVKDIPKAGDTSDAEITAFADMNDRIVVTSTHHAAITWAFAEADFIELGNNPLILHPRRSGTERQSAAFSDASSRPS